GYAAGETAGIVVGFRDRCHEPAPQCDPACPPGTPVCCLQPPSPLDEDLQSTHIRIQVEQDTPAGRRATGSLKRRAPARPRGDRTMEIVYARCCGLDVQKRTVVACRIVPGAAGAPSKEVRTFGTMTSDLLALADWLREAGCTHVAMESTGVFWKPIYNLL